ncbi:MAG: GNAT family protein [Ferruginibacter sp.]
MIEDILSVRELAKSDIELIASYWLCSEKTHLENMGVEISKMPTKDQFVTYMESQVETPMGQKQSYCIIWQLNNTPVGHSNTRPTIFAKEAFMHLHLWDTVNRRRGIGNQFVKLTLPYFFENLQLENLYCEPYALNAAPNKTMQKAGFDFVKEYITTPGPSNFEQPVKQWVLTREKYTQLYMIST